MSKTQKEPVPMKHKHHTEEAATIAGEIAGGVVGSAAGPNGMVAGMVVGAVAGAIVGKGLEANEGRVRAHDEELDEEIGIMGGDMGSVPSPPPVEPSLADWPMKDIDDAERAAKPGA